MTLAMKCVFFSAMRARVLRVNLLLRGIRRTFYLLYIYKNAVYFIPDSFYLKITGV